MKRVRSGCVLQTLVFSQKEEYNLSGDEQLRYNREEVEDYKRSLEKKKTRYQILEVTEMPDFSIVVRVRKHLNANTDTGEYFN